MMSFEPLWNTMKKRKITGYTLINKYGMSRHLWYKLRHGKNVTLDTIDRLCEILDCDVSDIVQHISAPEQDST
nr:helix-turn-helix transcriptional regulator [uncultured Acetatifactor sp.]